MADGLEHPAHLAVASLVEDELEPRRAEQRDPRWRGRAVVELDSLGEAPQHLVVGLAFDLRDVCLLDPVARVGEPVREWAVVRQEQHPRRVAVEASHRHDADLAADEIDDRRPALRVARCRDRPARLVEQDVAQRLLADLPAVDPDDVTRLDERVQLPGRAVDRDPAGLDQPVRAASRRDTGPGEVGVQPHEAILRR